MGATAIIYFEPKSAQMAVDLANRVRNDPRQIEARLVWGRKFRDERDLESCNAVIVQQSLPNSDLIRSCYENFAHDVEIHLVDDEGEFVGEEEFIGEDTSQESTAEGSADPAGAAEPDAAAAGEPPQPADEAAAAADADPDGGDGGGAETPGTPAA